MKPISWSNSLVAICCAALVSLAGGVSAADQKEAPTTGPPTFTGAGKCKLCHKSVEDGEQFRLWSEGPHAKAWTELASDKAKAIGKAKGIADPQKSDACLRCHVTGHGLTPEHFGPKFNIQDGVQCESCHGAGSNYDTKAVMESREKSVAAGMIVPDAKTCTSCHNEASPTYQPFDFATFSAKIAHPKPKAKG